MLPNVPDHGRLCEIIILGPAGSAQPLDSIPTRRHVSPANGMQHTATMRVVDDTGPVKAIYHALGNAGMAMAAVGSEIIRIITGMIDTIGEITAGIRLRIARNGIFRQIARVPPAR